MKKYKTICLRISEIDLQRVKEISINKSYKEKIQVKYTDVIREAIKEKIQNESNKKM